MRGLFCATLACLLVAAFASAANATTITVTSTADGIVTDGNCTLREAVQAANTNTAVDTCPAGQAITAGSSRTASM